jgi:hypothetical protein
MPQKIKTLAKELNLFIILQSQTTKGKAGDGDTPLGLDAAFGAAQFEQYMDYILTIWQPLRRVHNKTQLRATGYQYCKIRRKHKQDMMDTFDPHVLHVDLTLGQFRNFTGTEWDEFIELNKEATAIRKTVEKKLELSYQHGVSKSPKVQLVPTKKEG